MAGGSARRALGLRIVVTMLAKRVVQSRVVMEVLPLHTVLQTTERSRSSEIRRPVKDGSSFNLAASDTILSQDLPSIVVTADDTCVFVCSCRNSQGSQRIARCW